MNTARMLVGATIVACSAVAMIASSGGLAANDPRGDDEIGRPTKLLLGPEPKLPSATAALATGNPLGNTVAIPGRDARASALHAIAPAADGSSHCAADRTRQSSSSPG